MAANFAPSTIWTGDNLPIMRGMNDACVDLIYLDPPFNSNRNYEAPIGSKAAGASFKDAWTLSDIDVYEHGELADRNPAVYAVITAAKEAHGKGMQSYLIFMAVRLLEMHRILKPTGSIYLHCDPTASHYLKLLMDSIFGKDCFRNEIVWHYGKMSNPSRNFPSNHDIILRYSKTDDYTFYAIKGSDSEYKTRYKRVLKGNKVFYGDVKASKDRLVHGRIKKRTKELGRELRDSDILFDFDNEYKIQSDVIYCPIIRGNSRERTGYPTQKPIGAYIRRCPSQEGRPHCLWSGTVSTAGLKPWLR